jgi:hypothetical protein
MHGAVDGGAGDGEQLLQFADGVLPGAVQLDHVSLLARAELGLLTAQLPGGRLPVRVM